MDANVRVLLSVHKPDTVPGDGAVSRRWRRSFGWPQRVNLPKFIEPSEPKTEEVVSLATPGGIVLWEYDELQARKETEHTCYVAVRRFWIQPLPDTDIDTLRVYRKRSIGRCVLRVRLKGLKTRTIISRDMPADTRCGLETGKGRNANTSTQYNYKSSSSTHRQNRSNKTVNVLFPFFLNLKLTIYGYARWLHVKSEHNMHVGGVDRKATRTQHSVWFELQNFF